MDTAGGPFAAGTWCESLAVASRPLQRRSPKTNLSDLESQKSKSRIKAAVCRDPSDNLAAPESYRACGAWRASRTAIGLGPEMLREPLGGGLCRAVELVGVRREMTAGVELQPLRLAGAVGRR
jgi:hypothetical protein